MKYLVFPFLLFLLSACNSSPKDALVSLELSGGFWSQFTSAKGESRFPENQIDSTAFMKMLAESFDASGNLIWGQLDASCDDCCQIRSSLESIFLLSQETREGFFMDVYERILYNRFLQLNCQARYPPAEFVPQHAIDWQDSILYLRHPVSGKAALSIGGERVQLVVETAYPWEGRVHIKLNTPETMRFPIAIRIPGWAQNRPVPISTISYAFRSNRKLVLSVNEDYVFPEMKGNYAILRQEWHDGDIILLDMPLSPRKLRLAASDQLIIERGPIVFAPEEGTLTVGAYLRPMTRLIFTQEDSPHIRVEQDQKSMIFQPYFRVSGENLPLSLPDHAPE
ncbi:MAG: hypothetical protein AAF206_15185 [Bacteroidota bacterium]